MSRAGPALLLAGAALAAGSPQGRAQEVPAARGPLEDLDRAVASLVERCSPSVVRVEVERAAALRVVAGDADERRRLEDVLRRASPRESITATGFLADTDGLVLTTFAAADRTAEAIRVTFPGGAERSARYLGADPLAGVTVLRVEPVEGVAALRISGGRARAGSVALLLARWPEDAPTVQLGFVTGLDRAFGLYDGYMVASVPVTPGDAGGPLLDARGEVAGMAVAPGGGPREELRPLVGATPVGLGPGGERESAWARPERSAPAAFVPAAELRRILSEVADRGRVRRGMLGVRLEPGRTVVSEVPEGLPAARAGILPGDRLVSVDGRAVEDPRRLVGFVQRRAPGTPVLLGVISPGGGGEREVEVVLDEFPEPPPEPPALFNGIGVRAEGSVDLSAARFPLPPRPGGEFVVVRTVTPGSPADVAGLRPGDWILSIGGEPVASEDDYVRLALQGPSPRRRVAMAVYRPGEAEPRALTLK